MDDALRSTMNNCQLRPPPDADGYTDASLIAVMVSGMGQFPCTITRTCINLRRAADGHRPIQSLRLLLDSVSTEQRKKLRSIVVLDRADKRPGSALSWAQNVSKSSSAILAEQSRLGSHVWFDPVIENSCFGQSALSRGLNLSASDVNFSYAALFKNTVSYTWGIARSMQLAQFLVHIDDDWRVETIRSTIALQWMARAVELLQLNTAVSSLHLDTHLIKDDRKNSAAARCGFECSLTYA